jgi:hypothetical protein
MKMLLGFLLAAAGIPWVSAADLSSTGTPQKNTNAPAVFGQSPLFDVASLTISLSAKPQTIVDQNQPVVDRELRFGDGIDRKKNWVFQPPRKPLPPRFLLDWNFEQRIRQELEKLHRTNGSTEPGGSALVPNRTPVAPGR